VCEWMEYTVEPVTGGWICEGLDRVKDGGSTLPAAFLVAALQRRKTHPSSSQPHPNA